MKVLAEKTITVRMELHDHAPVALAEIRALDHAWGDRGAIRERLQSAENLASSIRAVSIHCGERPWAYPLLGGK